jgi:hypothetical protein
MPIIAGETRQFTVRQGYFAAAGPIARPKPLL